MTASLNVRRLPHLLLACMVLIVVCAAVAGDAQARPVIGLSDNTAAALDDPRFQATGIKKVRVVVPYDDVLRAGPRRAAQDHYFNLTRSRGIDVHVSFYRTYRCAAKCAARRLPSVRQYRAGFRAFRKRYPWVKSFSTWNEANWEAAQPTGRNPKRAAQFYKVARKECRRRCTVLAADYLADGRPRSARWLKTFKRYIGRGSHRWGLVPHPDVNRFSTKRTRAFLRATRGPVYVTEIGAINIYGRVFSPNQARQTKAMSFIMGRYARTSPRLKRMYVYHWRAAANNNSWDSALLDHHGTPRPALNVFLRGLLSFGR